MQYNLYWGGLVNLNNLAAAVKEALQAQAEHFLVDCAGAFAEQFQHFPEAVANLPGSPLEMAAARQARAVFEAEFEAAERQVRQRLEPFGQALEARLRHEFAAVLEADTDGFAGGRFFLDALVKGLEQAREEFCRKPLRTGANAYYESRIEKLISTFRLPIARVDQHSGAAVAAAVQALHAATDASAAPEHIPIHFLTGSWDHIQSLLEQRAPRAADARRLLFATCELFFTAALPLAVQRHQTRRLWDAMQGAEQADNGRQSLSKRRLFAPAPPGEQPAAQLALAGLEREKTEWQGPYSTLYRFYLRLVSELLWPQILRLLIVDELQSRLHRLIVEFTGFWAGVGAVCTEH